MFFSTQSRHTLNAYSDAEWASNPDDRRSVSAYCIFHGSNLVSWLCKQQQTVARSSDEAEYKVVSNAVAEVRCIKTGLVQRAIA